MLKSAKKLVLASHNHGKLAELKEMLGNQFIVYSLNEFTNISAEETGLTFIENAIIKARFAAKISNLPALADDSGLMVDYLNGAPGIYSARFSAQATDKANNEKLLDLLKNVPVEKRLAQFVCVLALVNSAIDPLPLICTGIWHGRILEKEVGEQGFGYDPLFVAKNQYDQNGGQIRSENYQTYVGNLPSDLKNKISHRALAFRNLCQQIHYKL